MALRILWDEEETAILLDALIQCSEGKISRDEAISSVSHELRERAKRKGIEIDDVFRNINGITLQMSALEYIYTKGKKGLDKKSKMTMFRKIVDMYNNDRASYEELLKGAKQEMQKQNNVQDEFFAWLSGKVSASQLSDYYMLYSDIEKFCYSRNIIRQKLFETKDLSQIHAVLDVVNTNKIFRHTYKKSTKKMSAAIKYYYDFIKEHQDIREIHYQSSNEMEKKEIIADSLQPDLFENTNGQIDKTESKNIVVDFYAEESTNLDFTEPVSISYFGEECLIHHTWKGIYAQAVVYLQDDYPEVFRKLLGNNIYGEGNIDVGNSSDRDKMISPIKISNTLYVETNYGATDIVKKIRALLDLCNVDYENVIIRYRENNMLKVSDVYDTQSTIHLDVQPDLEKRENINKVQDSSGKTQRSLFMEWLKKANTDLGQIFGYTMDIKKCSKFAEEKNMITGDLFDITNVDVLRMIDNQLFKEPDVITYASKHGGTLQDSFRKYIRFREVTCAQSIKHKDTVIDEEKTTEIIKQKQYKKETELENQYNIILVKYFEEDGYQLGRAIFRGRFKRFYNEEFGGDMPDSVENMEMILQRIGTVRDGRIFPKQDVQQNNLIDDMVNDIVDTLNDNASAVYIEAVYDKYQHQLAEVLQIYDMNALASLLIDNAKGQYIQKYFYLIKKGKNAEPEKDVLRVMKASHQPLEYEEIHKKLWYIPYDKMKHYLVIDKSIVNVAQETYFYAPNLPIDAEELRKLISMIHTELEYRTHITDMELIELIRMRLPSIAVDTESFTIYGLRNCLGYILRDYFSFNGPIISKLGNEISMSDVYAEYARQHEKFSLEDLKEFAKEMNTVIYWDAVMGEQVRISETEFVRRDLIEFDVDAIDAVLDGMCQETYIPIKDISLFLYFPTIGYQWNSYILESYLFKGSGKFRLLHVSFAQSDVCGAMVRRDSVFCNYQELIVEVLSRSNALKSPKSALQYIVDKGYQQRLRLTGIEQMVEKARLIKEKRENEEK